MIKLKKKYLEIKKLIMKKNYVIKYLYLIIFFITQNLFSTHQGLHKDLRIAVRESNKSAVQHLLQQGANPNKKNNNQFGRTVLFEVEDAEIAKLLLEAKANPHIEDTHGMTPLHYAVLRSYFGVAELLLKAGADPNLKTGDGKTPLEYADNNPSLVKLLLEEKADPNLEMSNGMRPLQRAIAMNKWQIVELLLKAKANPDLKDRSDLTPLQLAIVYNNKQITELLLDARINPFSDFESGSNPLKLAVQSRNADMVCVVFNHKMIVENLSSERKLKLIEFAIENGVLPETIQLLITSEPKLSIENILIEGHFFDKAFELFKKQNPKLLNNERIQGLDFINLTGIHILISLFLQYRYETHHLTAFNFQKDIPNSITEVIQDIMNLNTRNIDIPQEKALLDYFKVLIDWIVNRIPSTESPKDFFKQIFHYLQSRNLSSEEQNLLLQNIKFFTLKEYFLNQNISDRSDFKKLKKNLFEEVNFDNLKKLASLDEEGNIINDSNKKTFKKYWNFQTFEKHLRYIYAQELKGKLFSCVKKEDLMRLSYQNLQAHEKNTLDIKASLKNFNMINYLIHSICQTMRSSFAASLVKNFSETIEALQNEVIVQSVQHIHDLKYSGIFLWIESLLEQKYNQTIGKRIYEFYCHLDYIIYTKGANIYSDTPLKGKDILDFKK